MYYMSLPITKVATGWHITDKVSGVTGRIVRGWIHFSEDTAGGNAGLPPAVPAQDVFAYGSDQDLYDYHWDADNGWQTAANVRTSMSPAPSPVALTGEPSTNVYQLAGTTHESVFVIANDGHLYEYWWQVSDGWHRDDTSSVSPPPAGVSWTGSPSAFTYTNPADSELHHSVFLLGSNGHLYNYDWVQTATWSPPVDVSGVPPVAWSSAPSAFGWAEQNAEYQVVYIIGSDGHLYQYASTDGSTWTIRDVTAASQTPLPAGVQLGGTPSGYAFTPSGNSVTRQSVFVLGSDGHLYNYNWVPGQSSAPQSGTWDLTDVTAGAISGPSIGTGGVTLTGSPSALYLAEGSGDVFEVYCTGSDGHLYQYAFLSSGWTLIDASQQSGQPAATLLSGSPFAVTSATENSSGASLQMDTIYAVTRDGRLAVITYEPSGTVLWSFSEQSSPPGISLLSSSESGFAYG